MKRIVQIVILTLTATGLAVAQGRYGRGAATGPLDMSRVQTVSGTVTAVAIGYGLQYPSVTIGKVLIKVAPVWYLLEKDFEIQTGDTLSIQAAPSQSASDPYLHAIELTNTATNQKLVLRDALGRPLWANSQTTSGGAPMTATASAVASGVIEQINSGVGIQMPTVTLRVADASLLTFKIGPERTLLAADLELKVGETCTVQYVSSSCCGQLVAIAVTNAAGTTAILRR